MKRIAREPTAEMLSAGITYLNQRAPLGFRVEDVWSFMYDAAPDADAGRVAELRDQKDSVYLERNQLVAALARMFPSGLKPTDIPGWSDDWHGCVYIDLPTGQASWHYHDSHAYLFEGLSSYEGEWDGHSTEEKYERVAQLSHQGSHPPANPQKS